MITIIDQITLSIPLPQDSRYSNAILVGDVIKIESIPEYLGRVGINDRYLGMEVCVYAPVGEYNVSLIGEAINSGYITYKKYVFKDGISDESFVVQSIEVVDNLESIDSSTPLSANQGRVLDEKKQDLLESGTTIKTINGLNILGSGNIVVSGSGDLNDITYAELTAAIQNSTLVQGNQYRLTDFQTVHYMFDGTTRLDDINTGVLEPLILTATAPNKISTIAKSELYPQDIIYYDWSSNNWLYDVSFSILDLSNPDLVTSTIIPNFKGVIYRRVDTKNNNDIGCDFRSVKFRRWAVDVQLPNFNTLYTSYNSVGSNGQTVSNVNDYIDCNMFHGFDQYSTYEMMVINNTIKSYPDKIIYGPSGRGSIGSILSNSVFYLYGDEFMKAPRMYDNIIDSFFELNSVLVSGEIVGNKIGVAFISNIIAHEFMDNSFGWACTGNKFMINCSSNKIGAYFNGNEILTGGSIPEFLCNTIEDNCSQNVFSGQFSNNILLATVGQNNFMPETTRNTFGSSFLFHKFTHGVRNNKFGNDVSGYGITYTTMSLLNDYNTHCEVYKRPDGQIRLKYMDNNDQIVITNVNT